MGALDILKKAILNNPGGGAAAPMTSVQQESAAQQNAKPAPAPQAAGRVTRPASQTTGRAAGSAAQTTPRTTTPASQASARNTNTAPASTTPAVKPLRGAAKKTITDAFKSTIANASQASVPTVTQGQHNAASQQAARPAAQAAASNSTVRKKNTDSITSALGRVNDAVTAGSLRRQDAAGMYQTLSSRIGAPLPNEFHMLSSSLNETGRQLEEQYTSVVEPAYKAYQEAEQKYLNGELSRPEFLQARQNYVDVYNRYSPAWDAWNDMGRTNTQSYWSDSDLDEVSDTLELYNSAIEIGQSRIDELNRQLTDMVQNYNSAGAELQRTIERLNGAEIAYQAGQLSESDYLSFYDSYETQYNALNDAWTNITELEGQISAESLYLSEIASIGKYGYDTWERRYLDAHPEIGLRSGVGLEYDADGNVVRNDTNFTDIFSRIEALQADNAEGQNDREIAEYYRILNNGLAYVNMDSEELNSRRDYFQAWIDDAQPELESLAWLDDYNAAVEMGGSYTIPEGRDYDADTARRNELQSRVDQAKYWINQLNTREYEMTYDPVIKGLSQDTQDLINRFILNEGAADQAMELVRSNPRFVNPYETYAMVTDIGEQTSLDRQIRDALAGENLTEDQIRGILEYARYEADAVRADRMEKDIIESTAETNTFVNYLNQLFLSLGSGAGAVENAARGLWALGGNFDFDTEDPLVGHISSNNNIDPYLGKVAPINYNSFGNISTIAARAVGQGEFKRIQNFFVDDPENPDAAQQRMAKFAYNAYNLAESMGQSALIGLMAGAGMKNSLLLLSGSAASNTMQDLHEQGYSDAGVIVGGLVSGFAEYITEKVSLENLLSVYKRGDLAGLTGADLGKALGVNLLTQYLAEGSEEGASDLVNLMYDQTMGQLLNGGLTQIQYNAVQAQQANPSLSWEDAIEGAWQDWCKELGQDMLNGALSGGLMGAGGYSLGYVGGAINAANHGRQINQAGGNNRFELMAEAQELADRLGSQATGLNRALQRGADTDLQVGRLHQAVMDARALEAINTRLTELGEENASPELLRAINARAGGDHLLPGERIALSQSQHGQQVINELQAYNEAVQNAQEEGTELDLENVEQWTLDRALEQAATQSKYTETTTGSNYIAQRANEQKLRYEATQRANPEANILKPISKQIVDEGASPEVAAKQGEILGKVFSGTPITNKEMRALDMNNPAVRKVFIDRSGLTGIPSGTIQESLKRTYVNQVTRESALIQERQANLSADTDRLMEAKQVINAERVAAQQSVNERKQKNPFARIVSTLTGGGIRARNAANRRVEAMDKYAARVQAAARDKAIPTDGRKPVDIIRQVSNQPGNTKLLIRSAFVQRAQEQGYDVSDAAAVDNAYIMYLREAGLTQAEISAMQAASNMPTTGGANNGVQRGAGKRSVGDDGQRGAESVRKEAQGKTGTSKELGIPNGSEAGGEQLTEVTAEEVKKSPPMQAAQKLLTDAGVKAENVHFVQGNGAFIMVSEDGVDVPVRGVYDPDTQSVWILADDSSAAQLSPREIAAHELFHHYIITVPGLFDAIVEQMRKSGVYDEVVRMAQENYAKSNRLYGENLNRYIEEVMADAHANVNTMTGANARQFNKLVRDAVADALLSSPADVIGTGDDSVIPDIRTSAIEIPPEDRDAHHDSLGRKLAKRMDAFMANSFMREGLDEFVENGVVPVDEPLMVMYQGGGLGYLTFPDGRITFWSDRPEVSRTYSQGKYEDRVTTTHVQEHTAARQQIEQLEDAYDSLRPIAGLSEENQARLDEIAKQIRELHREVEPFSKDIYAPSKYRDVFPRPPKTVEDAKKLVERYGAYNRSAKLVETSKNADEAALEITSSVIGKAKVAVNYLTDIVNQLSQEINTGEDVEDVLGEPDWMQDEEPSFDWEEPGESAADIAAELDGLRDLLSSLDDGLYSLRLGYEGAAEQIYEIFEMLSEVDSYNVDDILLLARGWGAAVDFAPSEELQSNVDDYYRYASFDWSETTSLCRALYNVIQNNGATGYALDVKGLGTKKYFATDDQLIDYATELYHSTGGRGIYSCYLNITKPFVLDTKGLSFSKLGELSDEDFPDKQAVVEHKYGPDGPNFFGVSLRSRDLAEWAMDQRNPDGTPMYDGIILLNSQDTFGGSGSGVATIGGDKTSTVAITWNADVPKSTANTDPTHDSRITYSAVEDADAAVKNAMREFEWSENRSDQLNSVIQRLVSGENVSLQEMLDTIPEVIEAEKNSTRGQKVPWQSAWDADMEVAKSNFRALGSYNSDASGRGRQKWTGPIAKDHIAVIVMGPPAAGKSTIAVNELSELFHAHINDKDEYRTSFTGDKNEEDASFVEKPSGTLRRWLRDEAIKNGENVIYPTVGRGLENLVDEATRYRDAGYTVYLVDIDVDRSTSMARSLVRSFPSDGRKARYTNLGYAEEAATLPRQNFDAALKEMYTAADGTETPLFAGSALFDNSVLGRNAVLVGKSTIPGFRDGSQKGSTNEQQRIVSENGEADQSQRASSGRSTQNQPGLGPDSRRSGGSGRDLSDRGGRDVSLVGEGLDAPGNAGPNVKSTIRAIENRAEVQQQNEQLTQARHSAVETIAKARRVAAGGEVVGYDYSKPFAEQVDDWINQYHHRGNTWSGDENLLVGETTQVLRDIGFTALPMTFDEGHLKRIIDIFDYLQAQRAQGVPENRLQYKDPKDDPGHDIGPGGLKRLPDALKDPIAVIRSASEPTTSLVVLVDLGVSNGEPVLAAFKLNGHAISNGRKIDSYSIASAYKKRNPTKLLRDAIAVENQGKEVGVYYINKAKAASFLSLSNKDLDLLRPTAKSKAASKSTPGLLLHTLDESKARAKRRISDNTKTMQFKRWFDGSAISNSGKSPRTVYHVTDSEKAKKNGIGYPLTENEEDGSREVFARLTKPLNIVGNLTGFNARDLAKAIIFSEQFNDYQSKIYVRGKVGTIGAMTDTDRANEELVKFLKSLGYDGIRYQTPTSMGYIVFDANQIKATDNIGLYSPYSDHLRFSGVDSKTEKKRAAKHKAAEEAKIDMQWAVGIAQSNGEQNLKAARRIWQDKFRYATKTDRQWAHGMKQSERDATRAEGKRRTKEAVALDRAIRSLPATTAASNRRKVRKADQVPINDNQVLLNPIPSIDESSIQLPKSAAEFGSLFKSGYDKFYRAFVNATQEIDRMAKLMTRTDDLSVWTNIVRASRATVERFYSDAMLDQQGNAIGPSMEETFLCRDGEGNYSQELQDALNDYMFHMHNIDRMSLQRRAIDRVKAFEELNPWLAEMTDKEFKQLVAQKAPIALEYAQLLKEAAEAKDKPVMADENGDPVTAATSQKVVATYEANMPWLKEKAQSIYDWWDVFMREWAVGTSITAEQYEHMREIYPHYVPTYRVNKGQHAGYISGTATGITSGEMVKRAKGSTAPLQAMEDQFVQSMTQIVTNNRKNGFLRTLVEELLFDEEGRYSNFGVFDWGNASPALKQDLWDFADETEESSVEKVKVNGQEAYRVSCWIDGVKMSAYVNRAMFEGINFLFGRHSDAYNKIAKAGRAVTQPMKNMITGFNPTFAVKNIIRDQHTALTNSNAGIAYWKYLGQAAAKINANDADWVNFQALGGVSANETRVDGGFAKAMHPSTGLKKAVETVKEAFGKPGEISESVSRFAEYLATIDMLGGDSYENRLAAIRAAAEVTVDFGRSGSIGHLINMWVPYWNANVQGLDKAIRNIAEQPDVKSMLKRTSRAVLVNLIPAALQAALIGALKRWKDYEELNDQQKDNYYCIPVPGKEHKFLKIPKSQDWAAFISTPFIRIMEGVNGRDDPMEGWFESAVLPQMPFDMRDIGLGVEMPVLMPIFLDDLFDLASNKNWAGSAIIPYNLQKASPREQFDADTSLLAYHFGQMFNASPMAVDYIIDNYMGNFWGIVAKSVPISPLVSRGIVSGETKFSDRLVDAVATIQSPFISDSRVSNSTMSAYYDMINQLEQEVTDAGIHGDKKDAEHYAIYDALNQTGGYIDQIRSLTSSARTLTRGEEQNQIRWEAVGLADLAMEFVQKCLDGEIEDPKLWMTYAPYGEVIMEEAKALDQYKDDFNFSGALGNPSVIYDRSGDTDLKFDLSDIPEAQQEYVRLRSEAYQTALSKIIGSADYKDLSPTEKAARLEEAKRQALRSADQQMLAYLKREGIQGEAVGKADYSAEQRAAAYSVSWLLGADNAYKPELTDAFVSLYDYNDQYSFIPSESTKRTFKDPSNGSMVYVLDSAQQAQYASTYHDVITDFYSRVINTDEYRNAGSELRAAMLARAKTYANDEIKARFDAWLKASGATATETDQASAEISLEAKYAIQRALGDDHAMQQAVTDELVRLYQYSDVGEVQYFPITTAPKSYVDDQDKDYIWILDDDQREVYMGMMFDTYQANILKVMNSAAYKNADDYGKAQMLCDVRSRLSGDVQSQFKHWLRSTGAKRTYRNSAEAQALAADIDAAGRIVDGILGKARTYKQFNEYYGY